MEYHNIVVKYQSLKDIAESDGWIDNDTGEYENVDKLNSESMIYAERNSENKHTKRFDWSPALIQAVEAVKYWQHLLKCSKGGRVVQSTIELARQAAGLPLIIDPKYDQPTIVHNVRLARAHKRELQKSPGELRENYSLCLYGLCRKIHSLVFCIICSTKFKTILKFQNFWSKNFEIYI